MTTFAVIGGFYSYATWRCDATGFLLTCVSRFGLGMLHRFASVASTATKTTDTGKSVAHARFTTLLLALFGTL